MPDIVPRRRVLLASATALPLLLATAGCRSSSLFTGPDPLAGRPPLSHDVMTLQAVIASEENLVNLYRTAINGDSRTVPHDARTRTLGTLLAQHEQHLTQLRTRLVEPAGAPVPATGPASTVSASTAPASTGAARVSTARLRAAERTSAASLVQRLATVEPTLAQLFASIAASDATHATVLAGQGLG